MDLQVGQRAGGEYAATPATGARPEGADLSEVVHTSQQIRSAVESVIAGKPEVVRLALVVLLAEGHLLLEDVPGVGKTMLSKALARAVDCQVSRIQFTPDLLPSDITGVSVWRPQTAAFEFRPGGVFANIVIGDEINRASPKTQAAMLECMEERQVTDDGRTYELPPPFMVVATQNPLEMEGTYPLPEAQCDRFMARISMGYPVAGAELAMLAARDSRSPLSDLAPVATADDVRRMIEAVSRVYVSERVQRLAVQIATATRTTPRLRLGASPRATLHLVRAAKASAALEGRDHVLPDDIFELATPVLAHRLICSGESLAVGDHPADILTDLIGHLRLDQR